MPSERRENAPACRLRPADLERLERWARAAAPREACGCLLGRLDGADASVTTVRPARNLACAADRFELDPGDVVRAADVAAAAGLELLGIWHSHVHAPALPSALDRPCAWPGATHVIVSLAGGALGASAWRAHAGRLRPLVLRIEARAAPDRTSAAHELVLRRVDA